MTGARPPAPLRHAIQVCSFMAKAVFVLKVQIVTLKQVSRFIMSGMSLSVYRGRAAGCLQQIRRPSLVIGNRKQDRHFYVTVQRQTLLLKANRRYWGKSFSASHILSCWCPARLIPPSRWRQCFPPKRQLTIKWTTRRYIPRQHSS
jgi:hypothetical protein